MIKNTIKVLVSLVLFQPGLFAQDLVTVQNEVFKVVYSQEKEQPVLLTYISANRDKLESRKGLNFYNEKDYHTSNNSDYYKNPYDKGHLAPAATFADTPENLKQTFSYLNCSLQHKRLNRYLWKYLEAREREWDDEQPLLVTVEVKFTDSILPTGATLPSRFIKHIKFLKTHQHICFEFDNTGDLPKEKRYLDQYEVKHDHSYD